MVLNNFKRTFITQVDEKIKDGWKIPPSEQKRYNQYKKDLNKK